MAACAAAQEAIWLRLLLKDLDLLDQDKPMVHVKIIKIVLHFLIILEITKSQNILT